ncbi:MAG: hypothetical protein ACLQNG_15255 [Acidimicrobiales bacterium]
MEAAAVVVVVEVACVLEVLELVERPLFGWREAAVVPEVEVAAGVVLVLLTARREVAVAVVAVAAIAPTTASVAEALAAPATARARQAGWRRRARSGPHRPAAAADGGTCVRLPALFGSRRSTGHFPLLAEGSARLLTRS